MGKPTGNGFIEAFNSKLRVESLNAHLFMSLADVREKLEGLRKLYNEDRSRSAIGCNVPIAMHYPDGVNTPSSGKSREAPAFGGPKLGSSANHRRILPKAGGKSGHRSLATSHSHVLLMTCNTERTNDNSFADRIKWITEAMNCKI
ncbi:integrase core domain-containing protein [Pontivivens insulae]|uniref:integrase core domain-containing protein n=1 Tax=Pontivivens insulae TaxID=1639689 RepID=UPI003D15F791